MKNGQKFTIKSNNFEPKNSNKNLTDWYLFKLENNCANPSKLTILRLPLEPRMLRILHLPQSFTHVDKCFLILFFCNF